MQWNRILVVLTLLAALGTGCSGINTSHGVSPATFLLPGYSQQVPEPSVNPDATPEVSVQTIAPAN